MQIEALSHIRSAGADLKVKNALSNIGGTFMF